MGKLATEGEKQALFDHIGRILEERGRTPQESGVRIARVPVVAGWRFPNPRSSGLSTEPEAYIEEHVVKADIRQRVLSFGRMFELKDQPPRFIIAKGYIFQPPLALASCDFPPTSKKFYGSMNPLESSEAYALEDVLLVAEAGIALGGVVNFGFMTPDARQQFFG